MTSNNFGKYIWRGRNRIEVEKEENVFTAVVRDELELARIAKLSGVKEVKDVDQRVVKITVTETGRDKAMASIRSEKINGVCHHAYRPKNDKNTRYYLTDQIIIKFKPELSPHEIGQFLTTKKLKVLKEYSGQEKTYLVQVTKETGENPVKTAERLVEEGSVIYAEPNLVNRFASFYEPSDTYFSRQWHLKSSPAVDLASDADISVTAAWDVTLGSRKVVVAVIDDGFDLRHPDFNGEGKVVFPKDFVDGDSYPFPELATGDYHGTPCAGVAIAEENGYGVVGVAPRCAFMPVRFPMAGSDDLLLRIFEYAGSRADVISCSWGPPPVYSPLPQLLKDKFAELAKTGGPKRQGCVIVFAAGNNNAPVNSPNNQYFEWFNHRREHRVTRGPILNGFAANPHVLAVAASTSLNKKALYSNWGDEIAVCAPSDNMDPANPWNTYAVGRSIWTTSNERFGRRSRSGSRFTDNFGGTSSAAPVVAGVAGLVFSANVRLTGEQVKEIIKSTADRMDETNGPPNWSGAGKVNANKAVLKAKRG